MAAGGAEAAAGPHAAPAALVVAVAAVVAVVVAAVAAAGVVGVAGPADHKLGVGGRADHGAESEGTRTVEHLILTREVCTLIKSP